MTGASERTRRRKIALLIEDGEKQKFLAELLEQMAIEVTLRAGMEKAGEVAATRPDLCLVEDRVLGERYDARLSALERLASTVKCKLVVLCSKRPSLEAIRGYEKAGATTVLTPDSTFLEVMFEINRLLFPSNRELRSYGRVFGGFPVQYLHEGKWLQGRVYNISRQGAFIACDEPLPPGSRLELRFVLPDSTEQLTVPTTVKWINAKEKDSAAASPCGMGVMFLDIGSGGEKSLENFISARRGCNA